MRSGRDGPEKRGERGVGAGCEARASMRSGRDGPEKHGAPRVVAIDGKRLQ
jgi:hypothetical protein